MKPILIILHGWEQNSSDWYLLKQMFEKDLNVITLDLPGFGNEPLKNKTWGIPEYANWVILKLNTIKGDKIILGHSFGGRIASYIASNNPVWMKGLILYGAPCIYRPSLKIKTKIHLAKTVKFLGLKKFFLSKNNELKNADEGGLGKIFRNVVSFDQTNILPKINIPTILIWGEYDKPVPIKIAHEINKLIPNSQLFVMDQVGHNAHKENIYLFYGIIKNFIKNL